MFRAIFKFNVVQHETDSQRNIDNFMDKDSKQKPTKPTWEFYDLQEDPFELHNAYAEQHYEDIIVEMKEHLIKLRKELGDIDSERPWIKEIVEEQLVIKKQM